MQIFVDNKCGKADLWSHERDVCSHIFDAYMVNYILLFIVIIIVIIISIIIII